MNDRLGGTATAEQYAALAGFKLSAEEREVYEEELQACLDAGESPGVAEAMARDEIRWLRQVQRKQRSGG